MDRGEPSWTCFQMKNEQWARKLALIDMGMTEMDHSIRLAGEEATKKQDLSWTTRWPEMALRTGNFSRGILLIVIC